MHILNLHKYFIDNKCLKAIYYSLNIWESIKFKKLKSKENRN